MLISIDEKISYHTRTKMNFLNLIRCVYENPIVNSYINSKNLTRFPLNKKHSKLICSYLWCSALFFKYGGASQCNDARKKDM